MTSLLDPGQVLRHAFDDDNGGLKVTQITGTLVSEQYDNIALSYTGSNLTGVAYKLGATTVATLVLAYDGSNNLISVTKS